LGHFSKGNIQGFNRYNYANNNPYKYTDPDGKLAQLAACFGGPVGCAIGVGALIYATYHGVTGTQEALETSGPMFSEWAEEDDGTLYGEFGASGLNKGKKGKDFRGGKKKNRDQWGKYSGKKSKGFRKWWETEKQKDGSLHDLETEADRDEAYADYEADKNSRDTDEGSSTKSERNIEFKIIDCGHSLRTC
jgi:hypothetical protein